ncbi:transcriptional regulator MarR family [Patulibacter medicamentivorans]|jgi:DNA-binding MarR family transcriptional regulator|uniref:Transcriptional regulator MarR family n=1 Tax=Patulibacter medicamentivorans TaxID=1097667 RepID=H0E8N0_9ACTN|nr:MarR family transcriptional regulator [Patulibacter medicamentivorans]EHN10030.1 transcriptional regulator MarR family [Patulibacter medicamentivorans]
MTEPATIANDLRVVLGQLVRRLRAQRRQELSLSQAAVLGWIDREGAASITALAQRERVRPQSMAATVAALEEAGLVGRRPDPDDGRRTLVEVTPAGQEAIAVDRRDRESWLAAAVAELDEGERRVLVEATALLARIADR